MRFQARVQTDEVDQKTGKKIVKLIDLQSTIRQDAKKEYAALEGRQEFVERADHPSPEVKAVIKALRSEEWEYMDDDEAAERVIEALNEVRENAKRYVVVANLQWPDCPDFHLYACGPFNTERQAQSLGERFARDPATNRGSGRWRIVPILPARIDSPKSAWSKVKPEPAQPCCSLHHGWLKDELDQWTWVNYDENIPHWKEKGGW